MLIRRKLIRERAVELLDKCSVKKAPVDVEAVANWLNIEVVKEPAEQKLSGFILRDPRHKKVIIGVNASHHPNRQRFTIAHECGHFLLHQGEALHIDKEWSGYRVKLRDAKSSAGTNVDEMEANLFAAELLMPLHLLDVDLAKIAPINLDDRQIKSLADKYQVSTQALTVRLTYLGCIPQ